MDIQSTPAATDTQLTGASTPERRRLSTRWRAAVVGGLALVVGAAVPFGVAHADTKWTYVATFQDKASCDKAAHQYEVNNPGSYHCSSNGNPASSAEPTWTLYNTFTT
ncbi:hypothetical protein [Pseudonocardia phyllosphaerae]|uniref:hypothetical protein n=1 Tax=Pseudonocardia phyllosphaerae TaxID=3390502 RepID=UPI00397807CE